MHRNCSTGMIIPEEINLILEKLIKNKHEAYIVGGCVRDILRNVKPNDWDITTNAKPEQIRKLFTKNFYENQFGTVSVITNSKDETLKIVEITPFRLEGKYSDKRHPDEIKFAKTLEEDLARRDFTVNALALELNPRPNTLCAPRRKVPPFLRHKAQSKVLLSRRSLGCKPIVR